MYKVIVNGEVKKEYPHKQQCIVYCYNKGYIINASPDFIGDKGFGDTLIGGVEIVEAEGGQ